MAEKLIAAIWFSLLTVVSAQLQCHDGQTSVYQYNNEIKLYGEVEQAYEVSCSVELDCNGESSLSTQDKPAFDYVAHFYDLTVKEKSIKSVDAVKLCKPTQDDESTCGVDGDEDDLDEKKEEDDKLVRDDSLFILPVRFSQTIDGKIIRIQFMEKDLENDEVMNLKKGIISTFQTHVNKDSEDETEDEIDSNGRHNTHYSTQVSDDVTDITKEYDSEDDDVNESGGKVHVIEHTKVQNGEVIWSDGVVSSEPENKDDSDDDDGPPDVVTGIEVGDLIKSKSKYKLNLNNRRKRSADRAKRMANFKTAKFIETSIALTMKPRDQDALLEQLERLYGFLDRTPVYVFINDFLQSKDESSLQKLQAIIYLETKVGYEKVKIKLRRSGPPLVDILIPLTYGFLAECNVNWDTCVPLFSLFALGGGNKAEQVFQYMLSKDSPLTPEQLIDMVDLASKMANPSDEYISTILDIYESETADPEVVRSLLLVLGTLAGQDSATERTKFIVRSIILTQLEDVTIGNCTEDEAYVDALEAAGNMEDEGLLGRLEEIGLTCYSSRILQTGVLHAVRGLLNKPTTVGLLISILKNGDCDITEELLHVLIDAMVMMRSEGRLTEWPIVGLNEFDQALEFMQTNHLDCIRDSAIKYFRKKVRTDTKDLLIRLATAEHLSEKSGTGRLRKRSVEHATCSNWDSYRGRYNSIQSSHSFQSDRSSYNRSNHCLAHFRVGRSHASVDIHAGVFAGCNTGNSRGKLFGKVVATGQVFRKTYSAANIYTYLISSGSSIEGGVYAMVGGKTLISQSYRTSPIVLKRVLNTDVGLNLLRIPLYITSINIYLRISISVHLDLRLNSCYGTSSCFQVVPRVTARASVGTSISLFLIRGGADVGFNFNYHLKSQVQLKSACQSPCVSLSHGHQGNSISIEFWYQLREETKVTLWPPWKFRMEWYWGSRKSYGPNLLKWSVGSARDKTIASTC